jgi:hypothetical protein
MGNRHGVHPELIICRADVLQESVISSRSSHRPDPKENWPVSQTGGRGPIPESPVRKAVFEPQDHREEFNGFDSEEEDDSEMSSMADSEEWIGDDDRASDSIAPSIMSEPEYQRHRQLMQQPPRSKFLFHSSDGLSHLRNAGVCRRSPKRPFLRQVFWTSL